MNGDEAPPVPGSKAKISQGGFVKVRYGDGKQAIFNMACQTVVLLKCIRKVCACHWQDTVDLVDLAGEVMNLPERKSEEYGTKYLQDRGTYVLVKVSILPEESVPQYSSLLHGLEKIDPDLALKLHDLSKPNAKLIRAKWNQSGKKGAQTLGAPRDPKKTGLNSILKSQKGSRAGLLGVLKAATLTAE